MKIITISREFGSGGREIGKRLADILGWDYYDREIIQKIAEEEVKDSDYVRTVLNLHEWRSMPITFRQSFYSTAYQDVQTSLLVREKKVIEDIAAAGRDCIIVGRNADLYLKDYKPLTVFVCAETEAKLKRCRAKAPESEHLSDREIERNMKRIDKTRLSARDLIDGSRWGKKEAYQLIINSTDRDIKTLAEAVARYAEVWFGDSESAGEK